MTLSAMMVLVPGLDSCSGPFQTDGQTRIKVEFRLAESSPSSGLAEIKLPDSDAKIYLHKDPLITNEDIVDARVVEDDSTGQFGIEISFTGEASKRLTKATGENIGKHMAVLFNRAVVTAPVIMSQVSDTAIITGHYTREEASGIADGIRRK